MSNRFEPHTYAEAVMTSGLHAHQGGILYQWVGTHWAPISDEVGEKQAYRWIVDHNRPFASADNARKAHKASILWSEELPLLTSDIVIPCQNGYVHADGGRLILRDPEPQFGLQHVLLCDFIPDAPSAQCFIDFLTKVLPDEEVRHRVQEYIGYTMTADARYQRAQFWLGSGANGKGVLANVIQALHGKPEAIQLDALDGFNLSVLIGASLIYCDEVPRGRINEQLLKSMIAGERVQIDRKYRDPVSIHVRGKWLVLGNHLPSITDHSAGFWRRWDIVPFTVTIPEINRDPLLADRIIATELAGVLTWALEGLARLQARGAFDPVLPLSMRNLIQTAKTETNSVLAWCDDNEITFVTEHLFTKDDVFSHYADWCIRNGLKPMASPRFWTRLKDIGPVEDSRHRSGNTQVRRCNVGLPG